MSNDKIDLELSDTNNKPEPEESENLTYLELLALSNAYEIMVKADLIDKYFKGNLPNWKDNTTLSSFLGNINLEDETQAKREIVKLYLVTATDASMDDIENLSDKDVRKHFVNLLHSFGDTINQISEVASILTTQLDELIDENNIELTEQKAEIKVRLEIATKALQFRPELEPKAIEAVYSYLEECGLITVGKEFTEDDYQDSFDRLNNWSEIPEKLQKVLPRNFDILDVLTLIQRNINSAINSEILEEQRITEEQMREENPDNKVIKVEEVEKKHLRNTYHHSIDAAQENLERKNEKYGMAIDKNNPMYVGPDSKNYWKDIFKRAKHEINHAIGTINKARILDEFRQLIENTTDIESLNNLKNQMEEVKFESENDIMPESEDVTKSSYKSEDRDLPINKMFEQERYKELYSLLAESRGAFTRDGHTDSIKALDKMFKEQEKLIQQQTNRNII